MKRPNFFIVGAQKSGTTALSEYLRSHPNVAFAMPKEPHFFSEEFQLICPVHSIEEYLQLFGPDLSKAIAVGEASTGYLQSENAIRKIYDFNPDAKIIVMLRNPMDLVCSLHAHLFYHGHENEPSFEKAWALQASRRDGKNLPKDPRLHYSLQYSNLMKLGTQLRRVFDTFPSRQVKVILFDDFIFDTASVYRSVLGFLELPDDGRIDFPKINAAKALRFPSIVNRLRRVMPWKIREALRSRAVSKVFRGVLSKPAVRPSYPQALIEELKLVAGPEIELLSKLLDRDLSGWMSWPSH